MLLCGEWGGGLLGCCLFFSGVEHTLVEHTLLAEYQGLSGCPSCPGDVSFWGLPGLPSSPGDCSGTARFGLLDFPSPRGDGTGGRCLGLSPFTSPRVD